MEIKRDTLKNQIIPSIFHDKDGKKIIESIKISLKNNSSSKSEILTRFGDLKDYKDEGFWTFFTDFCNGCFGSEIQVNVSDDDSFESMIKKLHEARFDHIFVEDDSMKIVNRELLSTYVRENIELDGNTLNLSCKNCYKLIVPCQKEYTVNAGYHEPKEMKEYPNYFIKIEEDKLSVNIKSRKSRDTFFKRIKDFASEYTNEPIIEEFNTENLDSLNVDSRYFFPRLRDSGLFIKKVKFNNRLIYFNVGLKDLIDFDELIDSDYFLNSKMDFISFQKIEFIYSSLVDKKGHDFRFKVTTSVKDLGGNKYVKFMINYYVDNQLTGDIKSNIEQIFEQNGLRFNQSYELPAEYYINNIITDADSLKSDYNKLQQIDPDSTTLNKLIEEEVLNLDGEVTINLEKLHSFKNNILNKLSGETISINQSEYKINDVSIDNKNRQTLTIRIIKNDNDIANYKVIIYPDVRSYDKITSIILPRINYSYIIDKILNDNKKQALQYICTIIDIYLKNKYNLVLEKEANNSCTFLNDYCQNWEAIDSEITAQKAGNLVENHLNVLLKFIYKNYLLIGGQSAPDGYLTLNNQNYILDSKQHKSISQGEYDKVVRYIFTYALSQGLESTNNGIFIICRGKIKNSLNLNARQTWQDSPEFNSQYGLSFITIEYFLEIFKYIKESKVKSNPELLKQIYDSFDKIVSTSSTLNDSVSLIKREDIILKGITDSISEVSYTPARYKQL